MQVIQQIGATVAAGRCARISLLLLHANDHKLQVGLTLVTYSVTPACKSVLRIRVKLLDPEPDPGDTKKAYFLTEKVTIFELQIFIFYVFPILNPLYILVGLFVGFYR